MKLVYKYLIDANGNTWTYFNHDEGVNVYSRIAEINGEKQRIFGSVLSIDIAERHALTDQNGFSQKKEELLNCNGEKIHDDLVLEELHSPVAKSDIPKTASHYHKHVITEHMVGQTIDPAFVATMYNIGPVRLQALKKILEAGTRGNKGKIQDLEEAKFMLEREIDLLKLFSKGIYNE